MIPANVEAEQAVLGAILLSDEAVIPRVLDQGLEWEDFSLEPHRLIFKAMVRMHQDRRHVDVLTLSAFLSAHDCLKKAGGRAGLDLLNSGVPAVGHLDEYVRIVRNDAFLRRMRKVGYEIVEAAGRGRLDELRGLVSRAVALLPKDGPRPVEQKEAA